MMFRGSCSLVAAGWLDEGNPGLLVVVLLHVQGGGQNMCGGPTSGESGNKAGKYEAAALHLTSHGG